MSKREGPFQVSQISSSIAAGLFFRVWEAQATFNRIVREEHPEMKREDWIQHYLLGLVSEVDEVLREIGWKRHRPNQVDTEVSNSNIKEELADLTKYVLSLWEVSGFTETDMLSAIDRKNRKLMRRSVMERSKPEKGQPVAVCDLDGTIADWLGSWVKYLPQDMKVSPDGQASLFMELESGLEMSQYLRHKREFELAGGYSRMEVYPDATRFGHLLQTLGWYVVICTARPYPTYKRVWDDTVDWLERNRFPFDQLHLIGEQRVAMACRFRSEGHPVLMLDDDPIHALRGSGNGLPVWVRAHKYNEGCEGKEGVRRFSTLNQLGVTELDEISNMYVPGLGR